MQTTHAPLDPSHPITLPMLRTAASVLDDTVIPAATRRSALSDLEHTLAMQLNAHLQLGSEPEARVQLDPPAHQGREPVDIRAFLPGSTMAAHARAKRLKHERPDNARRRIERLLTALTPWALSARATATPCPVLTEFHTLADRVGDVGAATGKEQRRISHLQLGMRRFARIAAAHGVITVAELPTTTDAMIALLATWGLAPSLRNHMMWTLRTVRRLLADDILAPRLPAWQPVSIGDEQQRRIDERLPELARDVETWESLSSMKVGDRAAGNRSRTPHEALTAKTQYVYRAAMRQWASALLTLVDRGLLTIPDLPALNVESLWLTSAEGSAPRPLPGNAEALLAERRARRGRPANRADVRVVRPLALAVIDLALDHGLFERAARDADGQWPKSAAQMAFRLWSITERVALGTDGDEAAELLALRTIWMAHLPSLKDILTKESFVKDHVRMLQMVTLPQVVCLILPWWTLHELPRLEREAIRLRILAARPGASQASAVRAREAHAAFILGLNAYIALGTFTAEPSRITNVTNARTGREVLIEAEWSAEGELLQLLSIGTRFPGRDEGELAEVTPKTGSARPTWRWSRTIIDRYWFARYLQDSWLAGLRATGQVTDDQSLQSVVAEGRFAWLANADPRSARPAAVSGAFRDTSSVAERFGHALLLGLRAMGRTDLPTSVDTAAAEGFAYMFRPHAARLWWATYWFLRGEHGPSRPRPDGGVDEVTGWAVAMRATCDTMATLQKHYVKLSAAMQELMRSPLTSIEHPNAYDHLLDRTWWHDAPTDWKRVWRDPKTVLPDHLRALVQRDGSTPPPSRRSGTRRRAVTA